MEIKTIKKKDTKRSVNFPIDKILPKVRVDKDSMSASEKSLQDKWLNENKPNIIGSDKD